MSTTLERSARGLGMASERARLRMVDRLREQGICDPHVLEAMAAIPRHLFVEPALASRAYDDTALPIGQGQTISQPYVVARSLELALAGRASLDQALEVGTGCGYQAAVLARLVRQVYSIERIGSLAARARQTLSACGIGNVKVRHADGREAASNLVSFDAIIVAAATDTLPPNLPPMLAEAGRLVIPLGTNDVQHLTSFIRRGDQLEAKTHEAVIFVPLKSGQE